MRKLLSILLLVMAGSAVTAIAQEKPADPVAPAIEPPSAISKEASEPEIEPPAPEQLVTKETAPMKEDLVGPWKVVCGDKGPGCVIRQSVILEQGPPEKSLSLFLTPGLGKSVSISLVTTLDILIAPGVSITRSPSMVGAPVWKADFIACGPSGCQATALFDPDSVYGADSPMAVLVGSDANVIAIPVDMSRLQEALDNVKNASSAP